MKKHLELFQAYWRAGSELCLLQFLLHIPPSFVAVDKTAELGSVFGIFLGTWRNFIEQGHHIFPREEEMATS